MAEIENPETGSQVPNTGKVFTEDYVATLREEAITHRLVKKKYEKIIRKVFGLKDDEPITDDLPDRYQDQIDVKTSEALSRANKRLIAAEIKSLEGYDTKLVERLVDQTKLEISDDGSIKGLKEAVEALATEFPQIKKQMAPAGGPQTPNPPPDNRSEVDKVKEQLSKASSLEERIALREQLHQLEMKG